jgi:hypothetical protein
MNKKILAIHLTDELLGKSWLRIDDDLYGFNGSSPGVIRVDSFTKNGSGIVYINTVHVDRLGNRELHDILEIAPEKVVAVQFEREES